MNFWTDSISDVLAACVFTPVLCKLAGIPRRSINNPNEKKFWQYDNRYLVTKDSQNLSHFHRVCNEWRQLNIWKSAIITLYNVCAEQWEDISGLIGMIHDLCGGYQWIGDIISAMGQHYQCIRGKSILLSNTPIALMIAPDKSWYPPMYTPPNALYTLPPVHWWYPLNSLMIFPNAQMIPPNALLTHDMQGLSGGKMKMLHPETFSKFC